MEILILIITFFNNRPSPAPLAIFSSFNPLFQVKVQWDSAKTISKLVSDDSSSENYQGTKFGTLKKPMFMLFDMIIFGFNGKKKQNI